VVVEDAGRSLRRGTSASFWDVMLTNLSEGRNPAAIKGGASSGHWARTPAYDDVSGTFAWECLGFEAGVAGELAKVLRRLQELSTWSQPGSNR
jgi:hypothetical protein